jgi:hypothetical protein
MTGLAKLLLISILFMSMVIPARAAAIDNPKRALRKAIVNMTLFNMLYIAAIVLVYPYLL